MTDKEKMLNGQPFYGKDKELMNDKAKARSLANKYNNVWLGGNVTIAGNPAKEIKKN